MALIGTHYDGLDIECVADGAITQFTVVKLSTDSANGDLRVVVAAAATDVPFGVAQETVADAATVRVRLSGVTKISANGAYALADSLMVAASDGQVDTWTASAGANAWAVGIALHAATAAGDELPMLIRMHLSQGA